MWKNSCQNAVLNEKSIKFVFIALGQLQSAETQGQNLNLKRWTGSLRVIRASSAIPSGSMTRLLPAIDVKPPPGRLYFQNSLRSGYAGAPVIAENRSKWIIPRPFTSDWVLGMFLTIALLSTISRMRVKQWDGVVIDKKKEKKTRRNRTRTVNTMRNVILIHGSLKTNR